MAQWVNIQYYLPSLWSEYDPQWLIYDEYGMHEMMNNHPWQVTWKDYLVRSGTADDAEQTTGLWLIGKDQEPILVHSGTYATPVVIPDSNEVIATKFRQGE